MTELAWPQLSLSIAGLGVAIECNDARVIDQLHDRFTPFDQAAQIALTARIHLDPDPDPASIDRPAVFEDGRLRFTSINSAGSIDIAKHLGLLTVSNKQPLVDIEYFLRVAYALLAFQADGLMLHAAGIVRRNRAYLFFGPSGSGKSTTAKHSPDDLLLNDDLVILLPIDQHWEVYATPFWNQPQLRPNAARHAPLAGLYRLIQDRSVFVESIHSAQAAAEVIASTPIVSLDPKRCMILLERIDQIARSGIPIQRLHFLPDASYWTVIASE